MTPKHRLRHPPTTGMQLQFSGLLSLTGFLSLTGRLLLTGLLLLTRLLSFAFTSGRQNFRAGESKSGLLSLTGLLS
jgi:hypothetical protein